MGVDIFFCAEIRKKDKWQPLIWFTKPSTEKNSYIDEEPRPEDNGMTPHYTIFGGRAYHYNDVLADMNYICGYPDDISEDLKVRLPDEAYVSKGYFSYSALVRYLNNAKTEMLTNMLKSRDFQLVQHVNRIEKVVTGKQVKDKISTSYLSEYSIKQIYEEYIEDVWKIIELRNVIYYLADEITSFPSDEDIRIIYFMC